MADVTIPALPSLSSGDADPATDLVPVEDASASETKRMTLSALVAATGVEAGADVTDAANVAAAGAVMADGSVAMAADLDLAGFDLTDVGDVELSASGGVRAATATGTVRVGPTGAGQVDIEVDGVTRLRVTSAGQVQDEHGRRLVAWDLGISGTLHTMSDADHLRRAPVIVSSPSVCDIRVPSGLTDGTTMQVWQESTGTVRVIADDAGLTVRHPASFLSNTAERYSTLVITITDGGTIARVDGDMEAAP